MHDVRLHRPRARRRHHRRRRGVGPHERRDRTAHRRRPARRVSAATTVRVRAGELLVTDGPLAETKELIVGYDVLECADLDEAVEVARAHPMARIGRLELRPFWTP
ncbi:hypothetical protein I4I73_14885 [Pseudonocardia sp. KRD-184]|nr:hypothetical protein [Pseudonocardia oceani]MBW0097269.1 hypothetical protein [Pseudonocardia oceani]MBW0107905.1 hypothetical protein [Pseudonocardia oceani]MBW0121279.1 hypothetical protein [Pseudonocardia oceani]